MPDYRVKDSLQLDGRHHLIGSVVTIGDDAIIDPLLDADVIEYAGEEAADEEEGEPGNDLDFDDEGEPAREVAQDLVVEGAIVDAGRWATDPRMTTPARVKATQAKATRAKAS